MVLDNCIHVQYYVGMKTLTPSQWISQCAEKLHERWRTVETGQLEEVAVVIWQDESLRALEPTEAAKRWLYPVTNQIAEAHTAL